MYGYQFFMQGGDIQWGVPFHKVTRSFDNVVLQGHMKYFDFCIITTARPMVTKLDKVVTYFKKLQPIKSHNQLNTWSRDVTWLIINILSPLPEYLWAPNLAGWLHTMRSFLPWSYVTLWRRGQVILISLIHFIGLERKCLSRHRLLVEKKNTACNVAGQVFC